MTYPFGTAALVILLIAVVSGAVTWLSEARMQSQKPDLVFAVFSREHADAYRPVIAEFEKEKGVRVQLQVVGTRSLESRLQAALQVNADVPDMVELLTGTMGRFTSGPLEDVKLIDLTDKLRETGLDKRIVPSRFTIWSSRGRVFALPHDVHPVTLAYRQDVFESEGLTLDTIDTWDEFVVEGRRITRDIDGDGAIDRYMIDLPSGGGDPQRMLLLQRGGGLFDLNNQVTFDNEQSVQAVLWYVRATDNPPRGQAPTRIGTAAGWGQTLAQNLLDGRVLFVFCPDWRSRSLEKEVPQLAGKMRLVPLPAWEEGGPRTSTWGGTGLAFPTSCRNFDLAWELATRLYFDPEDLESRFAAMNIIPPNSDAWDLPEYDRPREFWGGQPLGRIYVDLAPDVPGETVNAFTQTAIGKYGEAITNISLRYQAQGDDGLEAFARDELKRTADYVRNRMKRNRFLNHQPEAASVP
jgi:arabinosaccharide transport system substrate-binding protein